MTANSTEADIGRRLAAVEEGLYNLQRERKDAPSTLDNVKTGTVAGFLTSSVPQGWLLLDGQTITAANWPALASYLTANGMSLTLPDYTDRFPVGAGNLYTSTSTGGSADAAVVSHTHTGPSHNHAMADHNHGIDANTTQAEASGVGLTVASAFADRVLVKGTVTDMATGADGAAYNTASGGTGATGSAGASGTGANLPPYRGLYWMIRT